MRILIDGQTLLTPEINRGIGKYFTNVVEHILAADFTSDFFINAPNTSYLNGLSPWARAKLTLIPQLENNDHGILKSQLRRATRYSDYINDAIEKAGIDVYWSPNALMDNVFLPARSTDRRQFAVTVFDLIPAVMEKEFQKHWGSEAYRAYVRKLELLKTDYDLYLHISEHTKDDFIRILNVGHKRNVVTPLAAGDPFRPYPFPKVPGAPDYVLYPGGFDPRKNMDRALEAFAELHRRYAADEAIAATRLVIVCHLDRASETAFMKRAKSLGVSDKIELAGFVTDANLVALYQKARCLFFPSLYEGFGLPVLEGLACGLPVAASNSSSIPEVAGGLAVYFDPISVPDMAEALYRTLREPIDDRAKTQRQQYAKNFSWQRTAQVTLEAFASCVTKG